MTERCTLVSPHAGHTYQMGREIRTCPGTGLSSREKIFILLDRMDRGVLLGPEKELLRSLVVQELCSSDGCTCTRDAMCTSCSDD